MVGRLISLRAQAVFNVAAAYWRAHPVRALWLAVFVAAAFCGVYLAIFKGFSFIISLGGIGTIILQKLFFILFFIIFFMVAISCGIIFYASSFRSQETEFLFTLPVQPRHLAFYKFIESAVFASWIPFFGLLLFFISYAAINHFSLAGAFLSLAYFVPVIILSCLFGYLVCAAALRFLSPAKALWLLGLGFIAVFWLYSLKPAHPPSDIFYYISDEIIFFKLSRLWFMPFAWAPWGLVHLEGGAGLRAFVFALNLWTLGLLGLHLLIRRGGRVFCRLFFQHALPHDKQHYARSLLDRLPIFILVPRRIRAFLIKDMKLFSREPVLWMQFVIFFGLLFFYFINLRKFHYHMLDPAWKNIIVFLNTFSVLCITGALSVRFIFPQWTLEGKSYWVLRLSPVTLKTIYAAKFIFSFPLTGLVSAALLVVSNTMMNVSPYLFWTTLYIVVVASLTIVSMALGFGAYFADFKASYYLKAVESLGGVITLVCNLAYVAGTIFTFVFLNRLAAHHAAGYQFGTGMALGVWTAASIVFAWLVTWLGFRRLEQKEY